MYLTKEEFIVLQAIKQGKDRKFLEETYGIRLYTNDPRIEALCKKYGVDMSVAGYRVSLAEKADLNKVEIIETENMPYYDYDEKMILVKRIPVCKKDVIQLLKTFDNLCLDDNEKCCLQYSDDGLGYSLDLIDKDNLKHKVICNIDGEEIYSVRSD